MRWRELVSSEYALVRLLLGWGDRRLIRIVWWNVEIVWLPQDRCYPRPTPLLAPPHGQELTQILVVRLVRFQRVQCFSQDLLYARILASFEQFPDNIHEFAVHVACESLPRVVRENAYEHDCIVLHMWSCRVLFGEKLPDLMGCGRGRLRRRLGTFKSLVRVARLALLYVAAYFQL